MDNLICLYYGFVSRFKDRLELWFLNIGVQLDDSLSTYLGEFTVQNGQIYSPSKVSHPN